MLSAEEKRKRKAQANRNWVAKNRDKVLRDGKEYWSENPFRRRINIAVSWSIEKRDIPPANQCICASCQERAWGYKTIRVCFDENRVFIAPVCRSCSQKSELPEIGRKVEEIMGTRKETVTSKYREFAMKYDTIPNDRQMSEFWNCTFEAIKNARRSAKNNGFVIEKVHGRQQGFIVTARPKLVPTVVQTSTDSELVSDIPEWMKDGPPVLPTVATNGVNDAYAARIDLELQRKAIEDDLKTLKDAIESSTNRLEIRINELAMIMAELVQITRSVWS